MKNLKVGDTVYVKYRYNNGRTLAVTKIGRQYITLENGDRIKIGDTHTASSDYPENVYASEQAYRDEMEVCTAWRALASEFSYAKPAHVTLETIAEIRRLIGKEKI